VNGRPDSPIIRVDENGDWRVGETRLLVDLIVEAYQDGETPEQIAASYDVVTPADVSEIIAYYVAHQAEVEAYLAERERRAGEVWEQIDALGINGGALRQRLRDKKKELGL
jgi:uncharacterized protein (DUF433 family)